jgi:hypothetical protein
MRRPLGIREIRKTRGTCVGVGKLLFADQTFPLNQKRVRGPVGRVWSGRRGGQCRRPPLQFQDFEFLVTPHPWDYLCLVAACEVIVEIGSLEGGISLLREFCLYVLSIQQWHGIRLSSGPCHLTCRGSRGHYCYVRVCNLNIHAPEKLSQAYLTTVSGPLFMYIENRKNLRGLGIVDRASPR